MTRKYQWGEFLTKSNFKFLNRTDFTRFISIILIYNRIKIAIFCENFNKTYTYWQHCAKQGTTTHLTIEKKLEDKYLGVVMDSSFLFSKESKYTYF